MQSAMRFGGGQVFKSEDKFQCFVSVEDGVLNEFEMTWEVRILLSLHFVVFLETVCHLVAEANWSKFSHGTTFKKLILTLTDTLTDVV